MARKIKIYITETGLPLPLLEVARVLGTHKYQNQFCVFCKATSMADANKKCEEAGLSKKTFQQAYTSSVPSEIKDVCREKDIEIALDPSHRHIVPLSDLSAIARGEQHDSCLFGGECAYPVSRCVECPRIPTVRKENCDERENNG